MRSRGSNPPRSGRRTRLAAWLDLARLERARALLRRRLVLRGVTLTIGLAGIAFAAIGAYQTIHRHDRQNLAVHAFMTQLKPCVAASDRDTPVVDTIGRNESPLDLAELHAFARRSAEVANEIARYDPGKLRDIWRASATEMHNSAVLLAEAAERHDRAAVVAAALRLDATCLKCHRCSCSKRLAH